MKTTNKSPSATTSCHEACCAGTAGGSTAGSGVSPTIVPVTAIVEFSKASSINGGLQPIESLQPKKPAAQGDRTQQDTQQTVFQVSGLDCGDCAAKLEKRIAAMSGVISATVNFGAGKLTVTYNTDESLIMEAIKKAGYLAVKVDKNLKQPLPEFLWWQNRRTQATIVSGILLAIATIADWSGAPDSLVIPLYILTAVIGGYQAAKSGFYSLRALSLDMNFLMTAAIVGAAAIGEWNEGATVAFLFSFGITLQAYTLDKTRHSIRSLMELAPSVALVRRNTTEIRLPVAEIEVGEIVIVKPGERIAMDGVVEGGASAVNQATITGESIPVEKAAGDPVFAGTLNEQGALEIRVTKTADNSTLARISHLVEEAQAQKAPSQQFVDVFAKYYTPLVLIAAAGVMVLPWLVFQQPFAPWFYNGLVLLVISCPCALVISTPVSIVSAIGNASRHGVLIKGGAYLEQMGSVKAVAFDKTGTLTQGRPVVTDIIATPAYPENELLSMAAGIEKWSEHPLAQAVVQKAAGLDFKTATNFKALVGRGAQAKIDGHTMYIGNLRLFEELGFDLTPHAQALVDLENQGKTVLLVGAGSLIYGLIAVADTLRTDSRAALLALHRAGVKHISMLTGDNERVARAIAGQLEIDSFYSELLPEDKVTAVKKIIREHGSVVMVGEGVNDAPALAMATVGVAMGVAGSDVALETADVALMTDDLGKLAYVIKLSHKTVAIIKQNIAFAILIKFIFITLLFLGMGNLWLAVLADMGASLLVTLNGMRLMRRLQGV